MQSNLFKLLIGISAVFFTISLNARILDGKEISYELKQNTDQGTVTYYLHGYEGDGPFLNRIEDILLKDSRKIYEYFKYAPVDPVHIVVDNDIQIANGSAGPVPKNVITLYPFPPTDGLLLASDDWERTLILHELTHIVHGDLTTGWLREFRNVFGSLFKWNLFAPRWFAEGIAVWSETEFTDGGRGRYIMNDIEVEKYLSRADSCSSVACLDEAVTYPYGALAYGLGYKFMNFVEHRHRGGIACLVRAHSNDVPYTVNNAFNECFDRDVDDMFFEFVTKYKNAIVKRYEDFKYEPLAANSKRIGGAFADDVSYDRGLEIVGESAIMSYFNHRNSYVAKIKLPSGELERFNFSDRLNLIPAQTNFSIAEDKYLINVIARNGVDFKREWIVVDKSMEVTATLDAPENALYAFYMGSGKYFSLQYKNSVWTLYNDQGPALKLEEYRDLNSPFVVENFLIYKSYFNGRFSLQAINLQSYERFDLYADDQSFHLIGHIGDSILLSRPSSNHNRALVINLKNRSFVSTVQNIEDLAIVKNRGEDVYFLNRADPNALYKFNGKASDFIALLRSESIPYEKNKFLDIGSTKMDLKKSSKEESYPQLKFFKPDYWMITGIGTDDDGEVSIFTQLTDPLQNHSLTLNPSFAFKPSKFGGFYDYNYQFTDRFHIGASTDIDESEIREKIETIGYLDGSFMFSRYQIPFLISYGDEMTDHKLTGKIHEKTTGVTVGFNIVPRLSDDLLNRFFIAATGIHRNEDVSYNSMTLKYDANFKFNYRFNFKLHGLYERRYKGLLEGSFAEYEEQPYFGPYKSDEFAGNIIFYHDAQFKAMVREVYRGWKDYPIVLNDVSLISGFEVIKSDLHFDENRIVRDVTYTNAYLGIDTGVQLAYLADLSFQALLGKLLDNNESSLTFRITTEF